MYKGRIDNIILPSIGGMKLKDVRDIHLQKILNSRKGKSKSDTSKVMNTIRAMFKKARTSRLIPFDPSEDLEMPQTTEGKRRSITEDERVCILNVAATHPAGLWVKLMLYCGLRPGETIALKWRNIEL